MSSGVAQAMGHARSAWNEKIEERTSASSYVLSQLKSIKISGFAPLISDYIQKKRLDEIYCSRRERSIRVGLHVFRMLRNCQKFLGKLPLLLLTISQSTSSSA